MQIMPATGKQLKVGDISQLEPNIHGGVKYIRSLIDDNFADQPMDDLNRALFAFAAYNAGPTRVRQLREKAAQTRAGPERLVQQRGADRRRDDRRGDGHVRRQHLQVLRRVPPRDGRAVRAEGRAGAASRADAGTDEEGRQVRATPLPGEGDAGGTMSA